MAAHTQTFQGIAHRLYEALLAPFAARLQGRNQVIVVPYSQLHYLPFHLLWDGSGYLGQDHDVVILPAASLITRTVARRPAGVLALSHSWNGRLKHTQEEATCTALHLGGAAIYHEYDARREQLSKPPCQVLHIAAHGQFRIDQPDFSFLNLDDGPLYIDDLFQHDLSYELVTLSACETARSQSAAGDETIGLGRGFLFAGAGALIASLWRVDDAYTLQLMDSLYRNLKNGATKAAALRHAQFGLLALQPGLHPAYWGAFELIGNADPLVRFSATA
jgi:CHAT domain-containing protein